MSRKISASKHTGSSEVESNLSSKNFFNFLLVLVVISTVWLGWQFYRLESKLNRYWTHDIRLHDLAGQILYLDEVLTMSARMASTTGNPFWEDRYARFEPQLDAAIEDSLELGSVEMKEFLAKTDQANRLLVEMEKKAFELVRHNDQQGAYAILSSSEYAHQKKFYRDATESFHTIMQANIVEAKNSVQMRLLWVFTLLIGVLFIFSFFWLSLLLSEKDRNKANQEAKEAAESSDRAKTIFLANMSHEMRTPLNAIMGFTQLVMNDPRLDPTMRENLKPVLKSGKHLLHLVNRTISLSRLGGEKEALELSEFDLSRMLREMIETYQEKARVKDLPFRFETEGIIPPQVESDREKLHVILDCLLDNAVKFTKKGRISVKVGAVAIEPGSTGFEGKADADQAEQPARLHLSRSELKFIFEVENTGPGIEENYVERIFQPFEQVEAGIEGQGGTGLGLAISRQYAELLGGQLTLLVEKGIGNRFVLELVLKGIGASTSGLLSRVESEEREANGEKHDKVRNNELKREEIEQLPEEVRKRILNAVFSGEMDEVDEAIKNIAQYDKNMAEKIQALASQFEYDKLMDLFGDK